MCRIRQVLISVIVVTYNAEKYIGPTLDSLYCQTMKDYEIWFIDGASTDNTKNILSDYTERFNQINISAQMISEHDRGIYDAMNKGIVQSKGKYGYFLNSGDLLYDKHIFENILGEFCEFADVIYGNVIDDYGYKKDLLQAQNVKRILYTMPFCHQAIFTKMCLLKEYLFDIDYFYCADYDMLLRMYLDNKKFKYYNGIVAIYSRDGISSNNTIDVLKQYKAIQKAHDVYSVRQAGQYYYRVCKYLLRNLKSKIWRHR